MNLILFPSGESPETLDIGAGLTVGSVSLKDGLPEARIADRTLSPEDILLWTVCCFAATPEGIARLASLQTAFQTEYGQALPAPVDLTGLPRPEREDRIRREVIARLAATRDEMAQRNVALMREAARLRQFHAQTQNAFARLERYVHDTGLNHRTLAQSFLPVVGRSPVLLGRDALLEQRLPGSSAGLCDIALSLASAPASAGARLTVELSTIEDGQVHACWSIPRPGMEKGWLRLSLPAGLGPDAMTALLRLTWDGAAPLPLDWSVSNPDRRFQAAVNGQPDGRTLALRLWKYVPGCDAPVPVGGHLPDGQRAIHRVIPAERLADAVNLTPANELFRVLDDQSALLVHVIGAGVSCGLLPDAVPPGTASLSARIFSLNEDAPDIEYAMAIAPVADRAAPAGGLPRFRPGQATEWSRLPGFTEGHLHLPLVGPLEQAHDLYLMTRLPEGRTDISCGWSSFSNIRLGA